MLYSQYFHYSFTIKFRWQVVTCFNLKAPMELLFYPSITTNNNPPPKIHCENIFKMLCTYDFSIYKNLKYNYKKML